MMQLHTTQLTGLLGAIMISAGLASPMALAAQADDTTGSAQETVEATESDAGESQEEDMVEVRISLPNGKTIIRFEPSYRMSARRGSARSARTARKGSGSVRSTSGRSLRGSSGSGGAAHASSGSSGGGSGGGSSGGGGASGSSGGSSGGGSAPSKEAELSRSPQAHRGQHSGVQSILGSQRGEATAAETATATTSAPASRASQRASSSRETRPQSVPTIGAPQYSQEGATGGQRVEFRDAGMGAAVIGNTVYFTGIEHVRADQMFDVVTGTKMGADMVIVQGGRLSSSGLGALSTWNTRASGIKLDFPSNTIVTFTMLSQPLDVSNPERIERTWTVRIR